MSRHDMLIEELLLRWDKHFERLLSILEKGQNAEHGSHDSADPGYGGGGWNLEEMKEARR